MSLWHSLKAQALKLCEMPGRVVAVAAFFLWSGCTIDQDMRCDDNQMLTKRSGLGTSADVCVCIEGAVPDARGYGCMLCGKNEIASNGKCACADGYARSTATGPCEKSAIGVPCTGSEDCSEPFPYCASDGSDRYCSVQDCSATSCPAGYACEQASGTSYCAKLPEGLGAPCTSNTECESGEAKTCDAIMSHSCILSGCATHEVTCPGYYACCDVSMFMPGFSLCVAPSELRADGECNFGTKVTP